MIIGESKSKIKDNKNKEEFNPNGVLKGIIFNPSKDILVEEVFEEFLEFAEHKLTVFGKDLSFKDNIWDITSSVKQNNNKRIRIVFSNYESVKKTKPKATIEKIEPMKEPLLSFAKSYIRYKHGIKPVSSYLTIIATFRVLERVLIEIMDEANPIYITGDILNLTTNIIKNDFSAGVAYRMGNQLQVIAELMNEKRMVLSPLVWKNPIKRPSDSQKVGKEADDNRNKKMPSKAALEALPEIFFNAKEPKDLFISSLVAILFSAPNRIGELSSIMYDCEVFTKDSKGNDVYGLRWIPEKGGDPDVKWIIPSMVSTIKEAVKRLKKLTKKAREVAIWYEENPIKVFLPPEYEYLRKQEYITRKEAELIIWENPTGNGLSFFKSHNISYEVINGGWGKKVSTKTTILKFKDLEKVIVKLLPNNFPFVNARKFLKFSEALIIQRKYEYNFKRGLIPSAIESVEHGFISDDLGNRAVGKDSIFNRFGYKELDGSDIKVNTHQFRHYLNTLAQKGGASQLDIAKWSGRKDVKQNRDYNHVSADEILQLVHESVGDKNALIGPLSDIEDIKKKVIISRDEFAQLKIRTAHKTEIGVCIHDFSMTPCQLHRDCINCTDLVCLKGEKTTNERIRRRKDEVKELLDKAVQADKDGHFNANRWVEHHSLELEKLNQLCEIFDNENVENGTLIQMSNISASNQIEQAQNRRDELKKDNSLDMDEMKNLLEDLGGLYE